MFVFFIDRYLLAHAALAATGLVAYVLVTHIGRQRRHPSSAIAWVLAIIVFPYISLPLFLSLGARKFGRTESAQPSFALALKPDGHAPAWANRLSAGLLLPPPRESVAVALLASGTEALEGLIAFIDQAKVSLDLCIFIFADDITGRRVADTLIACAARGCRVRILLDAVGGMRTSRAMQRALTAGGIDLRRFMPLIHNPLRGRGNLRNHRKFAVADGKRVWGGGRNIADEYFLDRADQPAWHDLSFVIEGELAQDAERVFERDWRQAGGISRPVPSMSDRQCSDGTAGLTQLIPSGPDRADDTIYAFLLSATYQAQNSILVATPYFVPDDALLQALIIACRRGVHFTLLLPRRSNHRLADWARERALRELTAAGADIQLVPGMLHAKLVITDEAFALCGSANIDGRSLFLNYELSMAFYGRDQIDSLVQWHRTLTGSADRYLMQQPSLARDIVEGLIRVVGFQL